MRILTYIRFNALEQQFVDLRVIPQMLGVNKFQSNQLCKTLTDMNG